MTRVDPDRRWISRLPVDHVLIGQYVGPTALSVGAYDNYRSDAGELGQSGLDDRKESGMGEQDYGSTIVQLIADLALAICGIHWTGNSAQLAGGVETNLELGAIRQEKAKPIAWFEAESAESVGEPIGLCFNIRE